MRKAHRRRPLGPERNLTLDMKHRFAVTAGDGGECED